MECRATKILVVDDLARARHSIVALLAARLPGTQIRDAADGSSAIALARSWKPDVVVLDVRMPGPDGLEVTRTIKAQWPEIGVVVLSLYGEYRAKAGAAGADAFVTKGEPPERLISALSAWSGGAGEVGR